MNCGHHPVSLETSGKDSIVCNAMFTLYKVRLIMARCYIYKRNESIVFNAIFTLNKVSLLRNCTPYSTIVKN